MYFLLCTFYNTQKSASMLERLNQLPNNLVYWTVSKLLEVFLGCVLIDCQSSFWSLSVSRCCPPTRGRHCTIFRPFQINPAQRVSDGCGSGVSSRS